MANLKVVCLDCGVMTKPKSRRALFVQMRELEAVAIHYGDIHECDQCKREFVGDIQPHESVSGTRSQSIFNIRQLVETAEAEGRRVTYFWRTCEEKIDFMRHKLTASHDPFDIEQYLKDK